MTPAFPPMPWYIGTHDQRFTREEVRFVNSELYAQWTERVEAWSTLCAEMRRLESQSARLHTTEGIEPTGNRG